MLFLPTALLYSQPQSPATGFDYSGVLVEIPTGSNGELNCSLEEQNSKLVCTADSIFFLPSMTTTHVRLQGVALQAQQVSVPSSPQEPCRIDPTEYFSDLTFKNNNCQGQTSFVEAPDLIFENGFEGI